MTRELWMWNVEEEEHEVGVCTWGGERCGCPAKTAWSTCRRGLCAPVGIAADGETFGVVEESPQTLEGVRCVLHSPVSLQRAIIWGRAKSRSWARAGWLEPLAHWALVSQADVSYVFLGPEGSQKSCRPGLTSGQRGGHDGR
uniref:Uncharacterized protein n=1 Tax=Theropithecus gelada TaxID=9565 RepID=A0A8D2ENG3_THEGE